MKYSPLILLIVFTAAILSGCKAVPTVYKSPDTTGLDKSGARLHAAVASAKKLHVEVQAATTDAKGKLATLSTHLDSLGGTIAALAKAAPFEMKSQIETAQVQIDGLHVDAQDLTMRLDATLKLESTEGQQLEEANAADKEFQTFKATYVLAAEQQTTKLNAMSIDLADTKNQLSAIESQSLVHKLMMIFGLVMLALVAFLWFTGRLAAAGATIASRI